MPPHDDEPRVSIPPNAPEVNDAPKRGHAPARARGGRWGMIVVAGILLAVGVAYATRATSEPPSPAAAPDVPHVAGDSIVFSEGFRSRIQLATTPVKLAPLTPVVSVVGTVAFNPEHMAAVGTRLRGLVRTVHKFEGDAVTKGELLAAIESAELGEAQARVSTLEAELSAAQINADRERQLREQQLSTAREYEVARAELQKFQALLHAARQRVKALGSSRDGEGIIGLGQHAVRSPIAGTIIERHVSTGQSVEADLVAYRVANLDQLWVELAVYERSLNRIRVGDEVALEALANPNEQFQGRIAHIGAQIDPSTRSADVRIAIDNKERRLRPGQAVTAKIEASYASAVPVLSVPNSAITVIDGQPTVFVCDTNTSVRAVPVELGATDGEHQQIEKGLQEGQTVAVRGVFALKSELFR